MADVVKYGIQIPNRVFVGGVAFDTKEEELKEFFQQFGKIKECKIIKDNQSISRGFAFVTFECKQDANQAQQKKTVFFKQKKLNLGPAIRQKGVVFNGAKEAGNEPVLSTGVYIHPSGYSYTVAPNGVWYFHNADGTPPSTTPGAPPMAYAPNTMQKIQSHSPPPMNGKVDLPEQNRSESQSPVLVPQGNFPMYHGMPVSPEIQTTQIIQADIPYPNGSYIHAHSAIGTSNIHVAFQNMSISTHPNTVPINHIPLHANNIPVSDHDVTSPTTPTSSPRYHYPNEMYPPYAKYISHAQPSLISAIPDHQVSMGGHRQITFVPPRPDYYPVMNSVYTYCSDVQPGCSPTYFVPATPQNTDLPNGMCESPDGSTPKRNFTKNNFNRNMPDRSPKKETGFLKHPFVNHMPIRNPIM